MPHRDPAQRRAYLKQYSARYYADRKPAFFARAKAHNRQTAAKIKAWLLAYLSEHPCVDCGEADLIVLEFDHRDGAEKLFNIGAAYQGKVSLATMTAEVAKCDVRCANCHRRKTYRERGFRHRDWDVI